METNWVFTRFTGESKCGIFSFWVGTDSGDGEIEVGFVLVVVVGGCGSGGGNGGFFETTSSEANGNGGFMVV